MWVHVFSLNMDPLIKVLSCFFYINHIHNILYNISSFDLCKLKLKLKFTSQEISRQKLPDFYNFLQSFAVMSPTTNSTKITFQLLALITKHSLYFLDHIFLFSHSYFIRYTLILIKITDSQ